MRNKEVVIIGFVTFCELIVELVTLSSYKRRLYLDLGFL